jgi:hypothetical protein
MPLGKLSNQEVETEKLLIMKTRLTLLIFFCACYLANAQLSADKWREKMFPDAGKIKDENATKAILYGDLQKNKTVSTIDGTVNQYLLYFPVTAASTSETMGSAMTGGSVNYAVRFYFITENECLKEYAFYDTNTDIEGDMSDVAKKQGYIEEEIDGDYLNGRISDRLDDCSWPAGTHQVQARLETGGKKGAGIIVSQATFPISSAKGSGLYDGYREQIVRKWTSGDASNTVDDEALLATIEKHLEKNWGYDVTTVNLTYLKYESPKNFRFEGMFAGKDPNEGTCMMGDLFGTGGVSSNGAYFINAGNNSMGFSPFDCDIAAEVKNR